MSGGESSASLGHLVDKARKKINDGAPGIASRVRSALVDRDRPGGSTRPDSPGPSGKNDAVIDVELSDALARAEAAEAEVARLSDELARKDEILNEARIALRTARLALRDHLRITNG